ncbi:MAG TPA: sn-glycerol-3-phosphate ABC transporter ATP-binding protein UgpC [Stenomitos sp.]
MANVVFDHIKKQYGDNPPVIKDLNLRIEDKEFLVLVGPSGCGKSTALRMIAGLEDISGGFLSIGDMVVNDIHPKNRDIAMVFQNYALYPHMTCYENMAFALKLRKMPKAEIHGKVMEAAKSLEIEHLLERKPKALSGGQRQRIAIGRAIVREPKVFLMDEPLSNLDAKLRVSMRAEIKKLHQRLQTTFVYVTHDQTEAMTLGDRIAIMKAGDLQQCDTPHEVYNNPANLFVATFIGSPQMNLLDGTMKVAGSEAVVEGKGFKFVLPKKSSFRDGAVVVGIRPEHMTVTQGDLGLVGQVEVTEPMGFETYVYLPGDRGPIIARVSEEHAPKVGETVRFTVDPAKIHVFDPQTEARLS